MGKWHKIRNEQGVGSLVKQPNSRIIVPRSREQGMDGNEITGH